MNENTFGYTSEERIFSALSHAAIVLPYLGLLAPLAIWITQREKSAWLRFQALQALVYQVLQFVFLMLGSCLMMPVLFGAMLFDYESEVVLFIITMIITFLPYIFWGLLILTGIIGGVICATGRDFRYPILGKQLERYLELKDQASTIGGKNE